MQNVIANGRMQTKENKMKTEIDTTTAAAAATHLMLLQLKSAEDKLSQYDRFAFELQGVRSAIKVAEAAEKLCD